jgi:hypothetical protein
MNIPLGAANNHTTERLLEVALAMLDDARREQNNVRLPANNWLTNNFTLEIIRAKVATNKANGAINVQAGATLRPSDLANCAASQIAPIGPTLLVHSRHRPPHSQRAPSHTLATLCALRRGLEGAHGGHKF